MLEKIMLTDKEYENLGKGLAIGAGMGIIIGSIIDLTSFCFTLGGVLGILVSLIYSKFNKQN